MTCAPPVIGRRVYILHSRVPASSPRGECRMTPNESADDEVAQQHVHSDRNLDTLANIATVSPKANRTAP